MTDLSNTNQATAVFDQISEKHTHISALINCVSTWVGQPYAKSFTAEVVQNLINFWTFKMDVRPSVEKL